MAHLAPETLIDLVEDVDVLHGPADRERSMAHLASCGTCREQFAEARQLLAAVADVDVPEPSPLFWNHLSARVRDAVAAEEPASWFARLWPLPSSLRVASAVSALAVVVLAVVLMLPDMPGSSEPERLSSASTTPAVAEAEPGADAAAEASLDLLATLADGMSWDDASEAGLTAAPAAVDDVIMGLTPEERIELQRLLQEELARGGSGSQGVLLVGSAVRVQG